MCTQRPVRHIPDGNSLVINKHFSNVGLRQTLTIQFVSVLLVALENFLQPRRRPYQTLPRGASSEWVSSGFGGIHPDTEDRCSN